MSNNILEFNATGWRPEDFMPSVVDQRSVPEHEHKEPTLVNEEVPKKPQFPQIVWDFLSAPIDHGPY